MSSVGSNYGMPTGFFYDLEALVNGTEDEAAGAVAVTERRGSMGRFVLSPFERAKEVTSPIVRTTSTVAASAMAADPSSGRSSAVSAFPIELTTVRPVLLVARGLNPDQHLLRPLPGYGDWIEHPALETAVVDTMKTDIATVQKLVLSRGVSLHDISDAVRSGRSVQELAAERAKHVTFAPQLVEVIPDAKKGCCVVQ